MHYQSVSNVLVHFLLTRQFVRLLQQVQPLRAYLNRAFFLQLYQQVLLIVFLLLGLLVVLLHIRSIGVFLALRINMSLS